MYDIFLGFYAIGARVTALWKPKARKWLAGRKDIFSTIHKELSAAACKPGPAKRNIWMHCASLGEFEQGRPLLQNLKRMYPGYRFVISFFSPSGYEAIRKEETADIVVYLPMDSRSNAVKFIEAINPCLVFWVKYEYWFYYLSELKRRNIPVILVSGIFRKSQPFFKCYGSIWRSMLGFFTHFFVQNESSKELLEELHFRDNVTVNGDTRFDRVMAVANDFTPIPFIDSFCGNNRVIVAGSTWEEDEIELNHYVHNHPEIKFIIAPHEIDTGNMQRVMRNFPGAITYSDLLNPAFVLAGDIHILIINNIGMLSRLYHYASIAYVGGGFGTDGVHNVLEAAVYGKPVIFGPEYDKYAEAIGLVESGGGISFLLPLLLEKIIDQLLIDDLLLKKTGEASRNFVFAQGGATAGITGFIQENRLLTS